MVRKGAGRPTVQVTAPATSNGYQRCRDCGADLTITPPDNLSVHVPGCSYELTALASRLAAQ